MLVLLLLLLQISSIFSAPARHSSINLAKLHETEEHYMGSINEFQKCANETDEYKVNNTFPATMTIAAASKVRDQLYACILTGERTLQYKDDYVKALGGSSNTGMPSLGGLFTDLLSGDVSSLAGVQNFAAELFKMAIAMMKNDVKTLDKYIASGDRKLLNEKQDRSEIETISKKIQSEAEKMVPTGANKEVEVQQVLLIVPKGVNKTEAKPVVIDLVSQMENIKKTQGSS